MHGTAKKLPAFEADISYELIAAARSERATEQEDAMGVVSQNSLAKAVMWVERPARVATRRGD